MSELERDLPKLAGGTAAISETTRLAVVGRGRMGGALARAARAAGLRVVSTGRGGVAEASAGADAVLLCVPDASIAEACESVVHAAPLPRRVGHVSGATPLTALSAAAAAGIETFSLHPLQTVPDEGADLTGSPCAVAGSAEATASWAGELAETLGMRPFSIPEEQRAAYHAAASIASNFLVALEEAAARLLESTGVEDGRELLVPLVLRTAANWAESGAEALTGPIARGDEATIARHLDALGESAPELMALYGALAEHARVVGGRA